MIVAAPSFPRMNKPVPDFKAGTTHGERKLADYKGKWLILFSCPFDFVPQSASEFRSFANATDAISRLNCELQGLSIDSLSSQRAWTANFEERFGARIPFPIIEDVEMNLARHYGLVRPGAAEPQVLRANFFVDPNSLLRTLVYCPTSNCRSVSEFVRLLQEVQNSDASALSMPERWKPGCHAIVAST